MIAEGFGDWGSAAMYAYSAASGQHWDIIPVLRGGFAGFIPKKSAVGLISKSARS